MIRTRFINGDAVWIESLRVRGIVSDTPDEVGVMVLFVDRDGVEREQDFPLDQLRLCE